MNTTKLLIGTLAATIVAYALDFLVYGFLLSSAFAPNPACERSPMPDMAWLIPGLVIMMFGFTYIYMKGVEAGTKVSQGIRYGLIFALIFGVGVNLIMYSVMLSHPLSYYLTDAVYQIVKWPIVGVVVAYATASGGSRDKGDTGSGRNIGTGGGN